MTTSDTVDRRMAKKDVERPAKHGNAADKLVLLRQLAGSGANATPGRNDQGGGRLHRGFLRLCLDRLDERLLPHALARDFLSACVAPQY